MTHSEVPRRALRADGYAALERTLVDEVRRVRASDPLREIDLLVGSNLLGLHLRRLLARRLGALSGLRTPTFLDLASRRAQSALAVTGGRPLPPLGDALIIARVVEALPPGGFFEPVRATPGFLGALLGTIRDLKDAGWSPADLRDRIARARPDGDAGRKLESLAWIFESYERALRDRRLYDRSDLLARAAEIARSAGPSAIGAPSAGSGGGSRARGPLLLVYGFYDLIELQWRLFEAEARGRETVVFVPAGDGPAFEYAAPMVRRMQRAGFEFARADAAVPDESGGPDAAGSARAPEIARLLDRLFRNAAPDAESMADPAAASDPGPPAGSAPAARSTSMKSAGAPSTTPRRSPEQILLPLTPDAADTEDVAVRDRDDAGRARDAVDTSRAHDAQDLLGVHDAHNTHDADDTDDARDGRDARGAGVHDAADAAGADDPGDAADVPDANDETAALSPEALAALPVAFLSAPSEEREAEEIAGQVLAWAGQGIRFHEIAVLARRREPHLTTLARAFRRARIPHVVASGSALAESPACGALTALLEITRNGWKRGDVMAFLSLADLPAALRELPDGTSASPSEWDLLSAEGGVVGGLDGWRTSATRAIGRAQAKIEMLEEAMARARASAPSGDGPQQTLIFDAAAADDDEDLEAERLAQSRRVDLWRRLESTIGAIERALAPWVRARSWQEASEDLRAALRALIAPSAEREAVDEALEDLGALDGVSPYAGHQECARAAGLLLRAARTGRGRYERDGVLLADVVAARGLSFRAVAVAGLIERIFPVQGSEDPVLLDAERAALGAGPGLAPLASKGARHAEETLLFRLAAGAARERLLLTRARAMGIEERESLSSPFLREAESAAGAAAERLRHVGLLPPVRIEGPTALDVHAWAAGEAWRLGGEGRGVELQGPGAALLRAVHPFLDGALASERARWGAAAFGPHDGRLGSAAAALAAARLLAAPVSASRLERYAACPLKSYFGSVLGLRPLQDPADVTSIDARDRGTLYHAILAECFAAVAAASGGILRFQDHDRETLRAALLETAERRFEKNSRTTPVGYPLLWEVEKERMRDNLRRLLDEIVEEAAETGYRPAAFEWTFGRGGASAPAVAIGLSTQGEIRFQGRIDRIDVHETGRRARVIDYKTKDSAFAGKDDRVAQGRTLQLPIYMRAAAGFVVPGAGAGTGVPDAPPPEIDYGGYVFISGDAPHGMTREDDRERQTSMEEALDVMIGAARAGDFTADPRDSLACQWCEFAEACGESRVRLFGRKRSDPAVASRLSLRGRA